MTFLKLMQILTKGAEPFWRHCLSHPQTSDQDVLKREVGSLPYIEISLFKRRTRYKQVLRFFVNEVLILFLFLFTILVW